jgi:hypothetical protein
LGNVFDLAFLVVVIHSGELLSSLVDSKKLRKRLGSQR